MFSISVVGSINRYLTIEQNNISKTDHLEAAIFTTLTIVGWRTKATFNINSAKLLDLAYKTFQYLKSKPDKI